MKEIIVDISWQDNYGASAEAVLGCVATHKTLGGIKKAYKSALEFHLEGLDEIPTDLKNGYSLVFKLDVHALLNHYKGIVSFSSLAKVTGINEKQLGHYAQAHRVPRAKQREKIVEGFHKIGKEFISVV